ncbi:MAG TPA: TetR/AcrR family transcriptional regulator [Blastocatellia bacterium]|jgi:AcrR family transcriptional regulator|nr:TetR/AcrR family transcriptional regulator [Blastocatellia bacterium]
MGESVGLSVPTDPKQARSKQTKEKIVQAAILLFEKRGYERTTSNDIAAEAGVSVGSFYVYFTDKRQLLLGIFDRLADELYKNIFDGLKAEHLFDAELRPRIRQAVANTILDKQRHSGLHRVISELVLKDAEFAERRKAVMDRSVAKLQELISLASKAGLTWDIDAEAASFVVQRVVFDLSQDYVIGNCEFDQDRAVDALTDMIYRFVFKPDSPVLP